MVTLATELALTGWSTRAFPQALINPRFIKPYRRRDARPLMPAGSPAFVTFEDHVKMGGFGSAVLGEALQEMGSAVPVVRIGWPDSFIEHGKG